MPVNVYPYRIRGDVADTKHRLMMLKKTTDAHNIYKCILIFPNPHKVYACPYRNRGDGADMKRWSEKIRCWTYVRNTHSRNLPW